MSVVQNDENMWDGLSDDDFLSIDLSGSTQESADCCSQLGQSSSRVCTPKASPLLPHRKIEQGGCLGSAPKRRRNVGAKGNASVSPAAVLRFNGNSNYQTKKLTKKIPLFLYKYGRLWVTDITQQYWCEQQLVYKYDPPPQLLNTEIVEPAEVTTGSSLHLARELQIQDVVKVRTTSPEDRFAVNVVNLLDAIVNIVHCGQPVTREIPIFGIPFNMGVFVSGKIDEIRCSPGTLDLEIREFKTRTESALPADAQKMTHDLQVMLYKHLFDEMVSGSLSEEAIAKHMRLNLKRTLGQDVVKHCKHQGATNLSQLLKKLFATIKAVPFIESLSIEYAFQKDSSSIGLVPVSYDEDWLRGKVTHALAYWKGERPPRGVDIEECSKCNRCAYNQVCTWRTKFLKALPPATPTAVTSNSRATTVVIDDAEYEVVIIDGTLPEIIEAEINVEQAKI